MNVIARYKELQEKYRQFKEGALQPSLYSKTTNNNTLKIKTLAQQQNYQVHSEYGLKPRVFIFGFTHSNNDVDQKEHLEKILCETLTTGDILLCEGMGPAEIIFENYHTEDFIGNLKKYFSQQNIRIIFNDDALKIGEFMVTANKLKRINEDSESSKTFEEAVNEYLKSFDARDLNFCYHKVTGIVPLSTGQSSNYMKPHPTAQFVQLAGVLHLLNEVMYKELERKGISYVSFIPLKM